MRFGSRCLMCSYYCVVVVLVEFVGQFSHLSHFLCLSTLELLGIGAQIAPFVA